MADPIDSLDRALGFVEQACEAATRAASVLRETNDFDELAFAAMKAEAELAMLTSRIRRAYGHAAAQ